MPFEIVRNDIVKMTVDAIVNTANPFPEIGSGVDTAIHKAAGHRLLQARKEIGDIARGDAAITPAFDLNAKYVIHTVGPVYRGGQNNESKLLSNAYRNSLQTAVDHGIRKIAFPSISTGVYSYPLEEAAEIAIGTVNAFCMEHPDAFDVVRFVLFDGRTLKAYDDAIMKVSEEKK